MSRTRPTILTALALSLTLAACGSSTDDEAASGDASAGPATVSVTDAQDRTVELDTNPETVVATDWSAIRTLESLGIEVDAVPTPNGTLPEDLSKYAGDEFTKIGDLFELDYEGINALEPDLVVVGSRSGTPEVVAELEKITPSVVDMSVRAEDSAGQLAEIGERTTALGSIFGKDAEATTLVQEMNTAVADLKTAATDSGLTAMFVQVSGGKASAYGPGSRFGLVYDAFGLKDTGAPVDEEGSHGQEIAQEFFVEYNPGVILVLDRAKAIGEEETPALDVLNNNLVNTTDAAKNDKVAEVEGFSWYLAAAAPTSVLRMVDDVTQAL